MSRILIGIGQTIVVAAVGLAVQQLIAAGIYGVFAYPIGTNVRVSWFDYVEEYLLWRIRLPTHGMTQTQILANALALVVVVVGAMVLYEGVLT